MEESSLEAFVRDWYRRVWNSKDKTAITEMASPDCVMRTGIGKNEAYSLEDFLQYYDIFCSSFPDTHFTVSKLVESGDQVAVYLDISFTHNGKHASTQAGTFLTFKDGKIVESWNLNLGDMLTTMDLVPENALELALDGSFQKHTGIGKEKNALLPLHLSVSCTSHHLVRRTKSRQKWYLVCDP